jgi:bifunctional N-acetylglucosamine-1-phosphate-uridyltransferase/glucosamine-1-phosphate-acetyltransferase GlmU-like protein
MSFKIEITPRDDPAGVTAYAVIVTIDDHETVVSFESKEVAERFAETERARLTAQEQQAGTAPPT